MDKASWHTTKQLQIPENITIWFLPPYSPELNPVELIWRELRAKYFNNRTFKSLMQVDDQLEIALKEFTKDKEAIKKLTKINYLVVPQKVISTIINPSFSVGEKYL